MSSIRESQPVSWGNPTNFSISNKKGEAPCIGCGIGLKHLQKKQQPPSKEIEGLNLCKASGEITSLTSTIIGRPPFMELQEEAPERPPTPFLALEDPIEGYETGELNLSLVPVSDKSLNFSLPYHKKIFQIVAHQMGIIPGKIQKFNKLTCTDARLKNAVTHQLSKQKINASICLDLIIDCKKLLIHSQKLIEIGIHKPPHYIHTWIREALTLNPYYESIELASLIASVHFLVTATFRYKKIAERIEYIKACMQYPQPLQTQFPAVDFHDHFIINHIAFFRAQKQISNKKIFETFKPLLASLSSTTSQGDEKFVESSMERIKTINPSIDETELINLLLNGFGAISDKKLYKKIIFWLQQNDLIFYYKIIPLSPSANVLNDRFKNIRDLNPLASHQSVINETLISLETKPIEDINAKNIELYYKCWWFAPHHELNPTSAIKGTWQKLETPIHRIIEWLCIELIDEKVFESGMLLKQVFQQYRKRLPFMPFDQPYVESVLFRLLHSK